MYSRYSRSTSARVVLPLQCCLGGRTTCAKLTASRSFPMWARQKTRLATSAIARGPPSETEHPLRDLAGGMRNPKSCRQSQFCAKHKVHVRAPLGDPALECRVADDISGEARAAYAAAPARIKDNLEKNMVPSPGPTVRVTLDANHGEKLPDLEPVDIDICAVERAQRREGASVSPPVVKGVHAPVHRHEIEEQGRKLGRNEL